MLPFTFKLHPALARFALALAVMASTAIASSGCSSARAPADGAVATDSSMSVFDIALPITLLIDSRNLLDLTLFVELPDRRHQRMGRVGPGSTTRWQVKEFARMAAAGGLRFWVEPVGTRAGFTSGIYSDRLRLVPGDTAKWVLESDLRRSMITVHR